MAEISGGVSASRGVERADGDAGFAATVWIHGRNA